MTMAPGFMQARVAASSVWRVSGRSGRCSDTTSASRSSSCKVSTRRAPGGSASPAGRLGDQTSACMFRAGAAISHSRRPVRPRPMTPRVLPYSEYMGCSYLKPQWPLRVAASACTAWRAVTSISMSACSATERTLACGV
ncbi:hypothetical protein DK45_4360 [Bordetella bronchiseptica]|nr:hypothetical protein DK45_4360 [Bordetella bronchiseptica]